MICISQQLELKSADVCFIPWEYLQLFYCAISALQRYSKFKCIKPNHPMSFAPFLNTLFVLHTTETDHRTCLPDTHNNNNNSRKKVMPSRRYIPSQATLLPAHSLSTLQVTPTTTKCVHKSRIERPNPPNPPTRKKSSDAMQSNGYSTRASAAKG